MEGNKKYATQLIARFHTQTQSFHRTLCSLRALADPTNEIGSGLCICVVLFGKRKISGKQIVWTNNLQEVWRLAERRHYVRLRSVREFIFPGLLCVLLNLHTQHRRYIYEVTL